MTSAPTSAAPSSAAVLTHAVEVAVKRAGQIRQVGKPGEVYAAPVDAWVASFVGEAGLFALPELRASADSVARRDSMADKSIPSPLGLVSLASILSGGHLSPAPRPA